MPPPPPPPAVEVLRQPTRVRPSLLSLLNDSSVSPIRSTRQLPTPVVDRLPSPVTVERPPSPAPVTVPLQHFVNIIHDEGMDIRRSDSPEFEASPAVRENESMLFDVAPEGMGASSTVEVDTNSMLVDHNDVASPSRASSRSSSHSRSPSRSRTSSSVKSSQMASPITVTVVPPNRVSVEPGHEQEGLNPAVEEPSSPTVPSDMNHLGRLSTSLESLHDDSDAGGVKEENEDVSVSCRDENEDEDMENPDDRRPQRQRDRKRMSLWDTQMAVDDSDDEDEGGRRNRQDYKTNGSS